MRDKNTQTKNVKNSFVFYRSYYEALSDLPDEQQLTLYAAICSYSLNLKEIPLSGICATIWKLIKPQIDANLKKWDNGKLGAEHGKKGGRPKKQNPIGVISETPNVECSNVNENVNENNNESENTPTPDFFHFSNYKTPYNELPEQFKQQTDIDNWLMWQDLNNHIDNISTSIREIDRQMDYLQWMQFKKKYIDSKRLPSDKAVQLVWAFGNHKQAKQKYISVFPALCKWAEVELKNISN